MSESASTTSKLGSVTHPDPAVRRKATDHLLAGGDMMDATGSPDLKLWFSDGTNYPGQDDIAGRQDRLARHGGARRGDGSRQYSAQARAQGLAGGLPDLRRPAARTQELRHYSPLGDWRARDRAAARWEQG